MSLYPKATGAIDPKYGRTFPDGYIPKALDSIEAAKARAIASLDADESDAAAVAAALDGSDEVPVCAALVKSLCAERDVLRAIPLDDEAKYLAAITAKAVLLDAATWVARQKEVAPLTKVVVLEK